MNIFNPLTSYNIYYKNYFISVKSEKNSEEVLVYVTPNSSGTKVKSVRAAKCLITRQINKEFNKDN